MVNFGTYLVSFRNPAWADYYIRYDRLKEALYNLQAAAEKLGACLPYPSAHP